MVNRDRGTFCSSFTIVMVVFYIFIFTCCDRQATYEANQAESRLMFTFVHSFSSQDHGHECRSRNEMGKQKINKLAKIKYKI